MIEHIREALGLMCQRADGAIAATVMGFDGLELDTVLPAPLDDAGPDVSSLLVEFSALIGQVTKSAEMFAAGRLEEVSFASERVVTLIRPLNEGYFVALALAPGANSGKGRYLLRVHAPMLAEALA